MIDWHRRMSPWQRVLFAVLHAAVLALACFAGIVFFTMMVAVGYSGSNGPSWMYAWGCSSFLLGAGCVFAFIAAIMNSKRLTVSAVVACGIGAMLVLPTFLMVPEEDGHWYFIAVAIIYAGTAYACWPRRALPYHTPDTPSPRAGR